MAETIYKLEHVTKTFSSGAMQIRALNDISFEINKGEIFGVIGMSGAGKSTLVRTLNRLEQIDSGRILYDGIELQSLPEPQLRQIRQSVAMVFQGFHLLNQKNVLHNAAIAMKVAGIPKKERLKRAREMLQVVGLEEKEKSYPGQLSGGQKQRVAIARALTMNPKVLLCDEATSALDPNITAEILALLKKINRELGITVVIITHEMSVVEKICDRVAVIEHGHLEEIGEVQKLFTNPESEVTRKLVFPNVKEDNPFSMTDKRCIRIVFDGRKATEPMIADIAVTTGARLNILSANTRSVSGVGYGQMIVELPKNPEETQKVMKYLKDHDVVITEVRKEDVS